MSWLSEVVGAFTGGGAKDAAKAYSKATEESNDAMERMFDKSVELNEPWRQSGISALNLQNALLGTAPTTGLAAPGLDAARETSARMAFDPYSEYVNNNGDLSAYYSGMNNKTQSNLVNKGFDADGDGKISAGEYGQYHWNTFGKNENRSLPTYQGGTGTPTTGGTGRDLTMPGGGGTDTLQQRQNDAYDLFNNSGFAKSMLETTESDMDRMLGAYAAGGTAMSGPKLAALNDRNRRNENAAFGQYYNALAGMSGTGANMATTQGQQGMQMAQQQGANLQNEAQMRGSSFMAGDAATRGLVKFGANALAGTGWF